MGRHKMPLSIIDNGILCRAIQSAIIRVIKQIRRPLRGRPILLITCLILQTELNSTQSYPWFSHDVIKNRNS